LSVNRSLDDLRRGFEALRERLDKLCDASSLYPSERPGSVWNQRFMDKTSMAAIKLLRSLESAASEAGTLADPSTKLYAERLNLEVDAFRVAVEGAVMMRVPSTDRVGQTVRRTLNLPTRGSVASYVLKFVDAEKFCDALRVLNTNRGVFFGAIEDIRMLYELRLLPMEERDRIRQALAEAGLPEVATRLEKADGQRVDDPPACIGHCREALALTVHGMAKAKAGRSTDSFAGDLAELGKTERSLSAEERRVLVALYSYLSSKWKSGEEPKPGDAEFALKQTYFFVDRLLGMLSPRPGKA